MSDDERERVPLEALRQMRCRVCLERLDAHRQVEAATWPKVDDVSLCWRCEALSQYAHSALQGWHLRRPDPDDVGAIEAWPSVREARAQMRATKSAGARPSQIGLGYVDPEQT